MDVEKPQMDCETFFNFFPQKGPPLISLIFYNRLGVQKSQRVPPFSAQQVAVITEN